MNAASSNRIRVWDLPTRLFHWALAAGVIGALLTVQLDAMEWHMWLGQSVLVLLAFRVIWGVIGGRWSRFAHFFNATGHDLKGSLSVLAMLVWLIAQALTGLVADDEVMTTGPLRAKVSDTTSQLGTHWHTTWGQWGVYALIGLHLAAVAWYVWRGRELVRPMVTGDKQLPETQPASRDDWRTRALALALVIAITSGYLVSIRP